MISGAPRPERERGRFAKAQSHTADTHALEESDRAILSMNQTNKEERSSAEPGEKRARAKENIAQPSTHPDTARRTSASGLARCASSSTSRQFSQVGAVCGNAARTVLCGGAISNDRPYRDHVDLLSLRETLWSLELHMQSQRWHQDRSAITVVPGIVHMLQPQRGVDPSPDMKHVIAFHNIFTPIL
jgi:hypothetical protein